MSKEIGRCSCGNGEGMFDDDEGYYVSHEDHLKVLSEQTQPLKDKIDKLNEALMTKTQVCDIFKSKIAELKESNTWVSVEERLPKEHNEFYWYHGVRIFAELPTGQKLNIDAQWTKSQRFVHNGIDLTEYVTHWQPLPTPPKQDELCNCPPLDVTTFDSDLPCDWCTTCGKKI